VQCVCVCVVVGGWWVGRWVGWVCVVVVVGVCVRYVCVWCAVVSVCVSLKPGFTYPPRPGG
jgi:hypothetical protein